jgi:putative endonuclease
VSLDSMEKAFCVYILASARNGTLYIGVTSNLIQRIWQHKEGIIGGFTKEHDVKQLVWYEQHENAESAIRREKQIKKWKREWKVRLVETDNPYWNDRYSEIVA